MKWIAPILVYLAVGVGLFQFHSAWIALLTFHLAIILSLWFTKPGIPLRTLFTGNSLRWTLICILLCGSSGLSLYLLWDRFGVVQDIPTRVEAMGLNPSNWMAFIAYFTLVNPPLEEYFWRAHLGNSTRELYVSDFLYAGFHGLILVDKVPPFTVLYSLAVLVLAGWFWRQVARADGGLRAPVLGHMAADFAILTAIFLRV